MGGRLMSAVLGIDISTFTIELLKLDENTDHAEWTRAHLEGGALAFDRLLRLPEAMPPPAFFDDIYLVAIEAPHGRGEAGTQAKLNQVVGAIIATLPLELRDPSRCWLVKPHEWKVGLGLKTKPTGEDITRLAPTHSVIAATPQLTPLPGEPEWQNGLDAYAIAFWARTVNHRGIQAALQEGAA